MMAFLPCLSNNWLVGSGRLHLHGSCSGIFASSGALEIGWLPSDSRNFPHMGSLAPFTALHLSLEWKFPRPFVLPFRVGLIVSLIGTLGGGAETIFGSSEKSRVHGPLGAFGLLIGLESMTSYLRTAPPVKDAKWPFHYAPVQRNTNLPSTQASLQGSHPDYARKLLQHILSFSPLPIDVYAVAQYSV